MRAPIDTEPMFYYNGVIRTHVLCHNSYTGSGPIGLVAKQFFVSLERNRNGTVG